MRNIKLYIPKIEDYWYEEKLLSDSETMSYNAGYDVSYYGYHYDTGCIDFPESRWEETYDKRIRENRYFAYIKDNDIDEYVGYVNIIIIKIIIDMNAVLLLKQNIEEKDIQKLLYNCYVI